MGGGCGDGGGRKGRGGVKREDEDGPERCAASGDGVADDGDGVGFDGGGGGGGVLKVGAAEATGRPGPATVDGTCPGVPEWGEGSS